MDDNRPGIGLTMSSIPLVGLINGIYWVSIQDKEIKSLGILGKRLFFSCALKVIEYIFLNFTVTRGGEIFF
ncbi:hypothetical protein M2391_002351 [Myroides odoratus]|nr:hypothetical protein [Myroides odoratus]